jgi:2-dehydro-3-deoxyphosphogluconate aldolase/(4S)-4-hydroxy-2-oxoglutarate aldolase
MAPATAEIIAAFESSKLIPVFYHEEEEVCYEVMKACYEAGIRVFEFTNRGEHARRNFAYMRDKKLAAMPDMFLGIGTIKSADDAKLFAGMGADFIVSPITDISIAEACKKEAIAWIPGCMTPSEIAVAEKTGASFAKLFPGNVLGPGFVTAIKPLFSNMKFMPTGGVDDQRKYANLVRCRSSMRWYGVRIIKKRPDRKERLGRTESSVIQCSGDCKNYQERLKALINANVCIIRCSVVN